MNSRFQLERRLALRVSLRFATTLGLLILAATSLDAGIIRVRTTATSVYPGHSVSDDSGLLEAASTAAYAASSGSFASGAGTAFGDALAISNAALGTLGAYTSALTTDRISTSYTVTADATAQFRDLLTVTSNSLPFGSPVSLYFTMTLSGTVSATGGAINGHALSDYLASTNLSVDVGSAAGGLSVSGTGTATNQHYSLSKILTLDAHVGDRIALDGFMQVHAWSALTGTTISDFSSTAHFYGDSLVQGVKLIGETGRDYSSTPAEVPEPATGALLLTGVLLVGAGKLRTRALKMF